MFGVCVVCCLCGWMCLGLCLLYAFECFWCMFVACCVHICVVCIMIGVCLVYDFVSVERSFCGCDMWGV